MRITMNIPFNTAPQGWQCPCCKTIYAPTVFSCAPCSMGQAPRMQPITIPSVWEPPYTGTPYIRPETTCDSFTVIATDINGWLINGEPVQFTPTQGAH
jgi:hypothetical protein